MIYAAESARITRKISRGLPSHESSVWGSEVHRRAISGAVNDRIPQCIVRKKSGSPPANGTWSCAPLALWSATAPMKGAWSATFSRFLYQIPINKNFF